MPESAARVPTGQPERYLKQLVSHLGHRAAAEVRPDGRGVVRLDGGCCTLTAEPDALALHATADGTDELHRVQDVVGRHLERFGAREGLRVEWSAPG